MDQLWKKESKQPDACYIDLLRNAKSNKYVKQTDKEFASYIQSSHLPGNAKNDRIALVMRNTGNDKFKQRKWIEAMDYYSQSLCYAEPKSEMINIAYANRSACFYQLKCYDKCLIDIKLAMGLRCPEDLLEKLENRKRNCLKALESLGNETSHTFSTPTLSYKASKRFPGMADVLDIKYNEIYGRHVEAKENIEVGKIVLIEKPFSTGASYLSKIEQCITCFEMKQNFIPCEKCVSAMFCGEDCKASNRIHSMECNDRLPVLGGHSRHAYNLVMNAIPHFPNANTMMEFVREVLSSRPKEAVVSTANDLLRYRSFLTMNITCSTAAMDSETKFIPIVYKAYTKLVSLPEVKRKFVTKQEKRFLMHLLAHHYLVLMSNMVDFWRIEKKAMFIIQSYFNYACSPNVLYYPHQGRSVCVVIRPIKTGDQLFVSYYGDFNEEAQVCHNTMLELFGFDCRCERCVPTYSESDLLPIMNDPNLKFLYESFEGKSWKNPKNVGILIDACLKLLNKFGSDPWNIAIEQVARWLLHCLYL